MHNLHYCVVQANSADHAIALIDDVLMGWGSSNNYYTIGGTVSENDEAHIHDKHSSWYPEETTKYAEINLYVRKVFKEYIANYKAELSQLEYSQLVNIEYMMDAQPEKMRHFFRLSDAMKQVFNIYLMKNTRHQYFDVLQHSFNAYQFDEFGVTQIETEYPGTKYVVFVDMHS